MSDVDPIIHSAPAAAPEQKSDRIGRYVTQGLIVTLQEDTDPLMPVAVALARPLQIVVSDITGRVTLRAPSGEEKQFEVRHVRGGRKPRYVVDLPDGVTIDLSMLKLTLRVDRSPHLLCHRSEVIARPVDFPEPPQFSARDVATMTLEQARHARNQLLSLIELLQLEQVKAASRRSEFSPDQAAIAEMMASANDQLRPLRDRVESLQFAALRSAGAASAFVVAASKYLDPEAFDDLCQKARDGAVVA